MFCDGTDRTAAVISGADPGETIEFTSPLPIDVPDGTADATGSYELVWSCETAESRLTWELTATGVESDRSRRFTISGSDQDPTLERVLLYEPAVNDVVCDETTHQAGTLTNAEPGEIIEFTSPDSASISPSTAGLDGSAVVQWTCSPAQDGREWRITAVGAESGRSAEFSISGRAPQPADVGDILVEMIENPFVCDRGRRPVARLTNLTPRAAVEFSATPEGDPLPPAEVGADGTLTVFWQCDRRDEGTAWELTVTESTPAARSATVAFGSTTLENPVTIEIREDPFLCNGTTREVGVLRNFVPSEAVNFESTGTGPLRQGRADADGTLPVRWTCSPAQDGTVWEITATGETSGASISFVITGQRP